MTQADLDQALARVSSITGSEPRDDAELVAALEEAVRLVQAEPDSKLDHEEFWSLSDLLSALAYATDASNAVMTPST